MLLLKHCVPVVHESVDEGRHLTDDRVYITHRTPPSLRRKSARETSGVSAQMTVKKRPAK